ncbi:MAG: helix-turn-helix domain-containing protein [Tannerella sp.]|jgi:plasmid maintenance system antidote protein VapI|nr:helix-turn-helix domain-containing protein [Tannerella sp.]
MQIKEIHIGQIIKRKFLESGLTKAEFAKRIDCVRTNVYHIFNQKSLDIEKLIKISKALDYDFIHQIYFHKSQTHSAADTESRAAKKKAPLKISIELEIDETLLQQPAIVENLKSLIEAAKPHARKIDFMKQLFLIFSVFISTFLCCPS